MYVYVCTCMYMYVCICMYIICACMCVYVCVYVCIYVYVCMRTCICIMYVCIIYRGELSGGNVLPKTGGGIVRGNCPTLTVRPRLRTLDACHRPISLLLRARFLPKKVTPTCKKQSLLSF